MAKYKKRSDGRYQANVVIGFDDNGKRIYAPTIYAKSIPELDRKKAEILSNLNKGTYANDKGLTIGEWSLKWYMTYKDCNDSISRSTASGYKNIIDNHMEKILDIKLKDLTKTDVQDSINALSGHYDLQRRLRLTLNQMLETAIDDGLIYKNVARKIELPTNNRKEKLALNEFETKAITDAHFSVKQQIFVLLLQYTGMRRGEVLALTKKDIDLKNDKITVNKSLSFYKNTSIIKEPKSKAGNRVIDILLPLKPYLESYLKSLDSLYLFCQTNGNLHTQTSYKRFWKGIYLKINAAAGGKYHYEGKSKTKLVIDIDAIKGLTPHRFRHNFATILYYAHVDIKEAQRIMGHSDIKILLEIYTHLDKQKSSSKDKINSYFAV